VVSGDAAPSGSPLFSHDVPKVFDRAAELARGTPHFSHIGIGTQPSGHARTDITEVAVLKEVCGIFEIISAGAFHDILAKQNLQVTSASESAMFMPFVERRFMRLQSVENVVPPKALRRWRSL
jgi:hypothetical protein